MDKNTATNALKELERQAKELVSPRSEEEQEKLVNILKEMTDLENYINGTENGNT